MVTSDETTLALKKFKKWDEKKRSENIIFSFFFFKKKCNLNEEGTEEITM